ncbi:MAG: hypothetical protein P3A28_03340 [Gemmatimonadota bacterium]|nr:hypothetical protein [Gemmatimonadota bacterium]
MRFPLLLFVALASGAQAQQTQTRPRADAPPAPRQVLASQSKGVNWSAYGSDAGGMKYSPLADINRDNVGQLQQVWSWDANEQAIPASEGQKAARPGQFQATALAIGDTLFFSTP